MVHHRSEDADNERRERHAPAPADEMVLLELEGGVRTEQVERSVRHVDDTHQPEDQREATRNDEVQAGGGEPVEQRDYEVLAVVDRRAEGRSTCDEEDPREGDDTQEDCHRRARVTGQGRA